MRTRMPYVHVQIPRMRHHTFSHEAKGSSHIQSQWAGSITLFVIIFFRDEECDLRYNDPNHSIQHGI